MNVLNKKINFNTSVAIIILISAVFVIVFYSQYKKNISIFPQDNEFINLGKKSTETEEEKITNQEPFAPDSIISPLVENSSEKINLDFSNDPQKKSLYCEFDSDCITTLNTCNCKLVCRNKQFKYFDNCLKACMVQEMDFTVQECQCQNNQCTDKTNEPS